MNGKGKRKGQWRRGAAKGKWREEREGERKMGRGGVKEEGRGRELIV